MIDLRTQLEQNMPPSAQDEVTRCADYLIDWKRSCPELPEHMAMERIAKMSPEAQQLFFQRYGAKDEQA